MQPTQETLYLYTEIAVDPGQTPLRLDRFLVDRLENVSRSFLQQKISEGLVQIAGRPVRASYQVNPGELIQIFQREEPRTIEVLPEEIPLEIVYEDADILVVNKQAGMVVHPGHGHFSGTLVNALLYYLRAEPLFQQGGVRPGLAHRIDKDTSGLLVVGKNEAAMSALGTQFLHHTAHRTYVALAWGRFTEPAGTVTTQLARDPADRQRMKVFLDPEVGKSAVTHWRLLEDYTVFSWLECQLETGRMHQIRVHMQYLKHPLFNDARYGGDKILRGVETANYHALMQRLFAQCPRQALHARAIDFLHPRTGAPLHLEAPLPADMAGLLAMLEAGEVEEALG